MSKRTIHGRVLSVDRQYVPVFVTKIDGDIIAPLIISVLIEKSNGERERFYNRKPDYHGDYKGDWNIVTEGDYVEIVENGIRKTDSYYIEIEIQTEKKGE